MQQWKKLSKPKLQEESKDDIIKSIRIFLKLRKGKMIKDDVIIIIRNLFKLKQKINQDKMICNIRNLFELENKD